MDLDSAYLGYLITLLSLVNYMAIKNTFLPFLSVPFLSPFLAYVAIPEFEGIIKKSLDQFWLK